MTEQHITRQRAQRIVDEITRAVESGTGISDAGPEVSALLDRVTGGDPAQRKDRYVQRFIYDAARIIAEKPWSTRGEVLEKLPPYGFRREEEVLQWAHWFGSRRERMLLVNRFLLEVQGTDIRKSVHDMMFETFRYEQQAIAAKVLDYLEEG
ncbi:MAG: hypothetical protein WAR22_12830 [Desulfomonilia bacterium]|jgi:hypothetical protein